MKIDDKDRKIIKQLQINARQSISQIAKKTGLPRDVVKYRIKKLEQTKLIYRYIAEINPKLLGYSLNAYVGFSLLNLEPEEENAFIGFLKANKNISYVAKTSGKWDILIGVYAKDYIELDNILRSIRLKYSKIIKDFDMAPIIDYYKYSWTSDLI